MKFTTIDMQGCNIVPVLLSTYRKWLPSVIMQAFSVLSHMPGYKAGIGMGEPNTNTVPQSHERAVHLTCSPRNGYS